MACADCGCGYRVELEHTQRQAIVIYRTRKQLDAALALWQRRLRLQDWEIKVCVVKAYTIGNDATGRIYITWPIKTALIQLLDPADYDNDSWEQDHEETLVHELIHLHTRAITEVPGVAESKAADVLEEQAVESLAHSFVRLARG